MVETRDGEAMVGAEAMGARRRSLSRALLVSGLLAALSGAAGLASCSLVVDSEGDQCEVDADCVARGPAFAGTTCSEGVCSSGCSGSSCCTASQECIDRFGEFHICRKDKGACVPLLTQECTTVDGNYASDDALILGSVLPSTGDGSETGKLIENAIKLAINDFTQTANGLPPIPGTTARRPLAFVGCSDASDSATGVVAAKHLVDDVGVPAIIGAAFSGITIKIATEVAIPKGVLMISPSATSVALTDLQDNGLIWRTSPSDIFQADALALYIPLVEANVKEQLNPGDPVRIAVLHKGDAYGSGLAKALELKLVFNGKDALDNGANYLRVDYGDPDDPQTNPPNYGSAVSQALAMEPHILLILGTNESVTDVFTPIESGWPASAPIRPRYLFSDGGLVTELPLAVGTNSELRTRIRGTVPGTDNLLFKSFRVEYSTKFNDGTDPEVFGGAGGYDALYLLAYSAVSLGAGPITGATLAQAMTKMVGGDPVDVGTTHINSTFPVLAAGKPINFNGASGPLDFDITTGEAPSDIKIWCVSKDASGKASGGEGSGLYYDALSGTLKGTEGAICN